MPPSGKEQGPQRKAGEILNTEQLFYWDGVWCQGGGGGENVLMKIISAFLK